MASNEPSSWGESIRQYEQSKKVLPFKKEDIVPAKRIGLCERRAMERELDPIVMQYRDSQKEEDFMNMTRSKSEAHLSKPRQKMAGTLNLFSEKPLQPNDSSATTKRPKLQRDWNLISHFPVDVHEKTHITADFEETQRLRPHTTVDLKARRSKNGREFNVISNEYFEDNEQRQNIEFERIKADVVSKYWKTHDYDFIKGEYIDGQKEARYREQRAMLGKVQGASQSRKLPPGVVYAPGNSYNIINQSVTDELKLEVSDAVVERNMNRLKAAEVTQRIVTSATLKAERDKERHDNRVSFQRWAKELDRGYDPIFRNDLTAEHVKSVVSVPNHRLRTKNVVRPPSDIGTPGRQLEKPHVARPDTTWARIQADDINNATALFNATGSTETLRAMAEAYRSRAVDPQPLEGKRQRPASSALYVRTGSMALSSRPDAPPALSARPPLGFRNLVGPSVQAASAISGGLNHSRSANNVDTGAPSLSNRSDGSSCMMVSMERSISPPSFKSGRSVPALDLSKTEAVPSVTYSDNDLTGGPGQPIAMIRTGGGGFVDC